MTSYLDWTKLLSNRRLGDEEPSKLHESRSDFERDCSRIVFSDSFRRLGRKTQVHPLAKNDHIHSRLTHSQEVAAFGGSLASSIWDYMAALSAEEPIEEGSEIDSIKGYFNEVDLVENIELIKKDFIKIKEKVERYEFSQIVQAASFAHDIGNPPFGHAGESAIREWMKSHEELIDKIPNKKKRDDIRYFEGNAQGLRLVIKTEGFHDMSGLNLTLATLGSMIKYPRTSTQAIKFKHKYNYLQSEIMLIHKFNKELGLSSLDNKIARHPLSYLMESADDVCYNLIDIEDAMEMGILTNHELKGYLIGIRDKVKNRKEEVGEVTFYDCSIEKLDEAINILKEYEKSKVISLRRSMAKYRSPIMNILTNLISISFINNYKKIMEGNLQEGLVDSSDNYILKIIIDEFKAIATDRIFKDRLKLEYEVGFNKTMSVLLNAFMFAADDFVINGIEGCKGSTIQIIDLMSHHTKITEEDDHYTAYLKTLDFISGMTDNYASYLSKQLGGVFSH